MNKNTTLILVCSILLGAAIFSSLRYRNIIHQKAKLEFQLSEATQRLQSLGEQLALKEELTRELREEKSALSGSLKDAEGKISRLEEENAGAGESVVSLLKGIKGLQEEITRAKEDKNQLEEKISILGERNARLDTKLSSIPELKKAIKELKLQMRKKHPKPALKIKRHSEEVFEGNFGYLIKDGVATYRPWFTIKVESAR
jgi:chromosome segregation ATPase